VRDSVSAPIKSSLSAVAYGELKAAIIGCTLMPGTMLAAQQLAERLQMSRTPVHEALKALSREGLVRVVPRVGYIVTPVTASDIDEIFALRLSLEGLGAALAAERITDRDVASLLEQSARGRALEGSGSTWDPSFLRSLIASNREFHVRIAALSGNRRLAGIVGDLLDAGERTYFLYYRPGHPRPAASPHDAVVHALEARDGGAARAAMETHIRDSLAGTRHGAGLP